MRVRRRRTRLTVLVAVAAVLGAVAVVLNTTGGSAAQRQATIVSVGPLSLPQSAGVRGFTTDMPPGWGVVTTFPAAGATDYQLTNTMSGVPSSSEIPPAGGIEIQILDLGRSSVPEVLGASAETRQPMALLHYTFVPHGVKDIVRSVAPHPMSVAGRLAASEVYTFEYEGRRDVQTELVSRRAGEIVSIQTDAAPALEARARWALKAILADWRWSTPAAVRTPQVVRYPPTGPVPTGEWIASGFTSGVGGDVANARLDQPDVRAWYFIRSCTVATRCRTTLVDQLLYGGTHRAPLVQLPNNSWWTVTFPASGDSCARVGTRPTLKETIRDTLHVGWETQAHTELVADETQTITGCGTPVPASVSYHWVAKRVPPPQTPVVSPNRGHAASAASFRSAAEHACTAVNAQAVPIARTITAAQEVLHSSSSTRAAKAVAEQTVARELRPLLPLSVEEYTQTPQPPRGPLDQLWLRDITAQRRALEPAAAALSALEAEATAASRFLRSGNALDLQTVVTQATLYTEDAAQLEGPAAAANATEQALRLPAICVNPPAINAIFNSPTITS
jgi:hypothetical protein